VERISTGNANLDAILEGGIPIYSVNVICGRPGTGKTVLTQQMMFHNASPERRALYLTTVSEPTIKVVRYQQQFSYFVADKVGQSVFFHDIGAVVREQGLPETIRVIVDLVKELRPGLVAIDSFKAIHDLAPSPTELRKFVYDLAVKMAGWQCTTLLVGEYAPEQIETEPEFAVADGVLQLNHCTTGGPFTRTLQIIKMRGTGYLDGLHSCRITPDGMEIYPSQPLLPSPPVQAVPPITPYGDPEIDAILGAGFPTGSHVLVAGAAGTGKTIFSLQYAVLGATTQDEPTAVFLFEESPDQVRYLARSFGWDLEALEAARRLSLSYASITDLNMDAQLQAIAEAITTLGARRAVIDSLPALLHPAGKDLYLISEKISQLTTLLKRLQCTTLSTTRVMSERSELSYYGVEESLMDGVILLKTIATGTQRKRSLEVYKLRGANPVMGEHRVRITSLGFQVFYTTLSARAPVTSAERNET